MSPDSPAYRILLRDYTNFHRVFLLEASVFTFALSYFTVVAVRRYIHGRNAKPPYPSRPVLTAAIASGFAALLMMVAVGANLSNVVNPERGFALTGITAEQSSPSTAPAALRDAARQWSAAGTKAVPDVLQDHVRARLAWQRPKAVVCSILLLLVVVMDRRVWQRLTTRPLQLRHSTLNGALVAVQRAVAIPATLLLMVMAVANTQAALFPLTLTLVNG